ncbi:hypothetical protein ACOME3_006067 [Neoechinorhynchus agilis]
MAPNNRRSKSKNRNQKLVPFKRRVPKEKERYFRSRMSCPPTFSTKVRRCDNEDFSQSIDRSDPECSSYNLVQMPKRIRRKIPHGTKLKQKSDKSSSSSLSRSPSPTSTLRHVSDSMFGNGESCWRDRSVHFNNIGGHDHTIKSLKETILFPLIYPDIFKKFGIKAPRGVIFHGPPGTGKTLMAHALASECSTETQKVSFYLRKGADCMSKYFGESEKHLRILFEEAYKTRPSIIFFDEIDGLAPARSLRTEMTHNTIVTTLLGLMDGIDSAAGIIVIGATNRIDTIDSALRRPGRFDREFYFGLPNVEARKSILRIHTRQWQPPLGDELLNELACQTKGFCGADLQALCREAVMNSFKKKHPQIYNTRRRCTIDVGSVEVTADDFLDPISRLTPASLRSGSMGFATIPKGLSPFFESRIADIRASLLLQCPALFNSRQPSKDDPSIYNPRLLVCEPVDWGYNSYLAPGLLRSLDLNVQCISPSTMYDPSFASPEEAVNTFFKRAQIDIPSVIFIRHLNTWWNSVPESVRSIMISCIQSMSSNRATLLVVTCNCLPKKCPDCIKKWFPDNSQIIVASGPSSSERRSVFEQVLKRDAFESAHLEDGIAKLNLNDDDLEVIWKEEEFYLIAFRLACRRLIAELTREQKFSMFRGAIHPMAVSDYYEVIRRPIDFSVIMSKIDRHNYFRFRDIFADLELVCQNAFYYNTDGVYDDRGARHKASLLLDTIHSLERSHMSVDAEQKLNGIFKSREDRKALVQVPAVCNVFVSNEPIKGNVLAAFVRYDPIVPDNVKLRSNHGVEGPLSADHPNFRKIITIRPNETKVNLFIEVIPDRKSIRNSRNGQGHCRQYNKANHSQNDALVKRAGVLVERFTIESKNWNLGQLEKCLAHIHQLIQKHYLSRNKTKLFDDLSTLL